MRAVQPTILALALRWLGGLRFPVLFVVAAALFLVDLVVPDMIPFADELLLGLAALLLGKVKKRRSADVPQGPA